MQRASGKNIFVMQIVQNGKVQRLAVPFVRLVQIDGDLHCHVWHSTSPLKPFLPSASRESKSLAPVPSLRGPRRDTANYWTQRSLAEEATAPVRSRPPFQRRSWKM